MRRFFPKKCVLAAAAFLMASLGWAGLAWAEEAADTSNEDDDRISITISPVAQSFQLHSNSTYEGTLNVTNAGSQPFEFEVFSAPYSLTASEENDDYSPNYNSENNYTQIARWITIRDQTGNFVPSLKSDTENAAHPTFLAEPGQTIEVLFRVTTPENIPAGGQYAAIFAQTLPKESQESGINALASLGMKVFGRSEEGEAIQSAEINEFALKRTIEKEVEATADDGSSSLKTTTLDHINGFARVKNTGNLDFSARGVLKVTNIFGEVYYETPENRGIVTIIPESELVVSDEWEETPSFGLYKATWTVTAGDESKMMEMLIFLMPPSAIIITIIVLTIVIIWIIMMVRKRRERRSRFAI